MRWKRVRRPELVREDEAQGRVREIYDDVKRTLGLPHVNTVFQAFAAYPGFLELFWTTLKPAVATRKFFSLAGRLRADAHPRIHDYFQVPDLSEQMDQLKFSEGARQELEQVVDLYFHTYPLVLVAVTATALALEGPIGQDEESPLAEPPRFEKPVLVEEENAPPVTKRLYEEMRKQSGAPLLDHCYRAFGRWPDFLGAYWQALEPITESTLYRECMFGLAQAAETLARELPRRIELSTERMQKAGLEEDDIAAAGRLTGLFQESLTAVVLNVAVARVGLEGKATVSTGSRSGGTA